MSPRAIVAFLRLGAAGAEAAPGNGVMTAGARLGSAARAGGAEEVGRCGGGVGIGGRAAKCCGGGIDGARGGGTGKTGTEGRGGGIGGAAFPDPASSAFASDEGETDWRAKEGGGGGTLALPGWRCGDMSAALAEAPTELGGREPGFEGGVLRGAVEGFGASPSNTSRSDPCVSFGIARPPRYEPARCASVCGAMPMSPCRQRSAESVTFNACADQRQSNARGK